MIRARKSKALNSCCIELWEGRKNYTVLFPSGTEGHEELGGHLSITCGMGDRILLMASLFSYSKLLTSPLFYIYVYIRLTQCVDTTQMSFFLQSAFSFLFPYNVPLQ